MAPLRVKQRLTQIKMMSNFSWITKNTNNLNVEGEVNKSIHISIRLEEIVSFPSRKCTKINKLWTIAFLLRKYQSILSCSIPRKKIKKKIWIVTLMVSSRSFRTSSCFPRKNIIKKLKSRTRRKQRNAGCWAPLDWISKLLRELKMFLLKKLIG